MKLYRVYIPKYFNDGSPIPTEILFTISNEIKEKFGGYSLNHFGRLPVIQGLWTSTEKKIYPEEMSVIELFVEDTFDTQKWFKVQKERWRQVLRQEELFVIVQDAEIISG